MFTLPRIAEYIVLSLALAALMPLCSFKMLGALQQAGYDGKTFSAWAKRKGNMVYSRLTLLAFLIALSGAVLAVCFTFTGRWAAYISLIPIPLFVGVYCYADKRALKVPLSGTRRAQRIYALETIAVFIAAAILVLCGNAAAYYADVALVTALRYLPLALLPVLLPLLLRAANRLDRPFSERKNAKFVASARAKLSASRCVKIGITGSFGKTSVKNMLADILSVRWKVLKTPASFNTPLGIARTVAENDLNDYDFFIAEMGARHAGDIRELCDLVRPDHCILTGICPQHLETFGSIGAIVAEKGEILSGTKEGGFAVIGKDEFTASLDASRLVRVDVGERCEVSVSDIFADADGVSFKLALGAIEVPLHTKLLGGHNAANIALAAALAYRLGMTKEEIAEGVERIGYIPHRLCPSQSGGATILDDSYNANVRGAEEAVKVLRTFGGRKFVVTPGLVELGVLEEEANEALGKNLVGLDRVILVGATLVQCVKRGYLAAGGTEESLVVVPTLAKAQEILSAELAEGDTVLFLNDLPDIYN